MEEYEEDENESKQSEDEDILQNRDYINHLLERHQQVAVFLVHFLFYYCMYGDFYIAGKAFQAALSLLKTHSHHANERKNGKMPSWRKKITKYMNAILN